MIFTVALDKDKLSSLFKLQSDYIDVQITGNFMVMFINTVDAFCAFDAEIHVKDPIEDFSFRIPKKGFIELLETGDYEFVCGDTIQLTLRKNQGLSNNIVMEFPRQICNADIVHSKYDLISKIKDYSSFDVQGLRTLARLLRTSHSPLVISNGYVFSNHNNLQFYAKVNCKDCALFPTSLNYLLNNLQSTQSVYDVKNCVIMSSNQCHIIIYKAAIARDSDLDFINKQKVIYSADVDFTTSLTLITRIKKYSEVTFDLKQKRLSITSDGCNFSTNISIRGNNQELDATKIPDLNLPVDIFNRIITSTKTKKFKVLVTTRFTRVVLENGIMIVC